MNTLQCPKLHVIACDLDDSLVATQSHSEQSRRASDEALRQIGALVMNLRAQSSQAVYFGSATGRTFGSIQQLAAERPAFDDVFGMMDFHITSVGSAIYTGASSDFRRVSHWPNVGSWDRTAVADQLSTHPDLTLQELAAQDTHKISYTTKNTTDAAAHAAQLKSRLGVAGLQADVVVSGGGSWRFVDVLPAGVNKGIALLQIPQSLYAPSQQGFVEPEICRIAAGDSMNDQALLAAADVSIIPRNGQPDLLEWAANSQSAGSCYIADEQFAAGVLRGLQRHLYGS